MSLDVIYTGVQDGVAVDWRGNISLIGFHVHVLRVDAIPADVRPFLVVALEESESNLPGTNVGLAFSVLSPEGDVVFRAEQPLVSAPRKFPKVPNRYFAAAQVAFRAPKAGFYNFKVVVSSLGSSPMERSVPVFIGDPESLMEEP